MSQVIRCFLNADLRYGHIGLAELAKKYQIKVSQLEPGQFLIFVNGARNKMKVYTAYNIVAYIQTDKRIDLGTIQYLPAAFKAKGKIDYDHALRERIQEVMSKRGKLKNLEVI